MGLRGLPWEKALATIVHLLETTLIRVGNTDYAKQNNSYGLNTLRDQCSSSSRPTIQSPARRSTRTPSPRASQPSSGQTILAESLIEKPSASYVYGISNKNGPQQVFVAQFFLRSCAIKEERSEEKSFEGALKFKQAWQYYNELLGQHSAE